MIKVLLKKEFKEIGASVFSKTKNKKNSSKGTLLLVAFVVILLLASFFITFYALAIETIPNGLHTLYFSNILLYSLLFGLLLDIFSSYGTLYKAKDTELLLSLPIKTSLILFTRLVSIYLFTLIVVGVVFIPGIICYLINAKLSVGGYIKDTIYLLLIYLSLSLFISSITALFGWLYAKTLANIKNKVISVTLTILFYLAICFVLPFLFGYFVGANVGDGGISGLLNNGVVVLFTNASLGDTFSLLIIVFFSLVIFGLTYWSLSFSYFKLIASKRNESVKKYRDKKQKRLSLSSTLLKKEILSLFSDPMCALNRIFGLVLMLLAFVMLLIKKDALSLFVSSFPYSNSIAVILILSSVSLLIAFSPVAASSISLESNTLWNLKALPIDYEDILETKAQLQIIPNLALGLILGITATLVLGLGIWEIVIVTMFIYSFSMLDGYFSLMMGVIKPTFNWTNPVQAAKQSVSVFVSMFIPLIYVLIPMVLSFIFIKLNSYVIISFFALLNVILYIWIRHWLKTGGTERFAFF